MTYVQDGLLAGWAEIRKEILLIARRPVNLVMFAVVMYLVFIQLLFIGKTLGGGDNLRQIAGTEDYLGFAVVGFLMWNVLIKAMSDISLSVSRDAMTGCLEHLFLSPVHSLVLFLARGIASLTTTLFFLILLVVPIHLTRPLGLTGAALPLTVVLLVSLGAIYGFTFILAGLSVLYKQVGMAVQLLEFIFLFLCGVVYPLEVLPPFLQAVGQWLPITYAVTGLREVTLSGAGLSDLAASGLLWKLSGLSAAYLALGMAVYVVCVKAALRRGSLNQY